MNRTLIAIAIAGTVGALAVAVEAQALGPDHGHHAMMANPLDHITKELNLTADQQAKITPIIDQAKPQIVAIHREAMEKTHAIMESTGAQIRPLLTPEQQQKFDAIRKAHEDMRNAMEELHSATAK